MPKTFRLACTIILLLATVPALAAGSKGAFIKAWERRPVVVKRTLFSLVYNERPRFMPIVKRDGKTAGLTVATATDTYYRFAARRDYEQDVVDRDPARVFTLLQDRYRRSAHLDVEMVQDIEPVIVMQIDPGMALQVQRVSVDNDEVRLDLRKRDEDKLVTTLTLKWATPLSSELVEAPLIDQILSRYLVRQ